ncbi:MAG: sugar transferase [Candidatus Magnetoovum sp. WYHC-5]|nr:sugar transferase [Candidatus Magnetoovum sp. WYHC-5]
MTITRVIDKYLSTGYGKFSYFLNRSFNILVASILLILALPAFLVFGILIKLEDGGPIFYVGARLGKNKRLFNIYKLRTLVPDAESLIGAKLLDPTLKLETRLGKFLRDTRIDELPQLYNILKGDMDFIGPRPERPLIYEKICQYIKGYDKRFDINPGLIGYAQLFTPHSTDKRIRTLIDNTYIQKKQNFVIDVLLIIYTAIVTSQTSLKRIIKYGWKKVIIRLLNPNKREQRVLERITHKVSSVYIYTNVEYAILLKNDSNIKKGRLININEEAALIYMDDLIVEGEGFFRFERPLHSVGRHVRYKNAIAKGTIYRKIDLVDKSHKYAYVISYQPTSPLNSYMVHQYFLMKSFIYR